MSFPHHENAPENRRLMELFQEQQKGTAPRQYPAGRLCDGDEGELAFFVESEPESSVVSIRFPKPVTFVAMSPAEAIQMAQLLIKHARSIAKEPLKIILH